MLAAGGLWLPVMHNLACSLEHGKSACREVGAATLSVSLVRGEIHQVVLLMDRLGKDMVGELIVARYRHSRRSDAYRHRLRF